jgi:hypothetical protein
MGAYLSKPITEKVLAPASEEAGKAARNCAFPTTASLPVTPVTGVVLVVAAQESEDGESEQFKYGVAAMQGWRTEMVRVVTVLPWRRMLLRTAACFP